MDSGGLPSPVQALSPRAAKGMRRFMCPMCPVPHVLASPKIPHPRTQLLVRFGYGGDGFFGVSPQPDRPTAGEALYRRLADALLTRPKALQFSTRTDRGVHAVRNLATCWSPGPVDGGTLAAVAAPRPDGLVDVQAVVVPISVHARGISTGKHYRYRVRRGEAPRSWWVDAPLDVDTMREVAASLVGRRDFAAFRSHRCNSPTTIRTLRRVSVSTVDGGVDIDVEGDAFLRRMVRFIVGLLVDVGRGEVTLGRVTPLLAGASDGLRWTQAPAHGLTLVAVQTAEDWFNAPLRKG